MIRRPVTIKADPTVGQVHAMASRMRRYFAPASIIPPPGTEIGINGNRNVALTKSNQQYNTPGDQAVLQLVPTSGGATVTWTFATKFNMPPICTATAVVTNPHGVSEIVTKGPGSNVSVIFVSSDPNDNRQIQVHAHGNPN
jgi:hypothetical protein